MGKFDFLYSKRFIDYSAIIGIFSILAAAYTAFWSLHPDILLELIFLIIGISLIILRIFLSARVGEDKFISFSNENTIGSKLIYWLTWKKKLIRYFPIISIGIIIFVYIFNKFISVRSELGQGDYLLLTLAIFMIFYSRIPLKYVVERDFIFVFLVLILILLIFPLAIYNLYIGDPDAATTSPLVHAFVTIPAAAFTNLFGVNAIASFEGGASIINFPIAGGGRGSVGIALGCSGLYSVIIFFCAFMSYFLITYEKIERRLILTLLLGLFFAWFANIIRISLTVSAGSWWGVEALTWFHENIGIIIFLLWTAIFWYFIFKYVAPGKESTEKDT